jgi:hypothetical protein
MKIPKFTRVFTDPKFSRLKFFTHLLEYVNFLESELAFYTSQNEDLLKKVEKLEIEIEQNSL